LDRFLQITCDLFSCMGHCMLHAGGKYGYVGLCGWIYSFHMPLFMMLSGYVSVKIVNRAGNVMRRFEQLIVPSVFLFAICSVVNYSANWWFLKSLFVCYVVWTMLFYLPKSLRWSALVLLIVFVFPAFPQIPYVRSWKLDWMLPFFGIGMLLHKYDEIFKRYLPYILICSALLFVILWMRWKELFIYYNSMPAWIDYSEKIFFSNDGLKSVACFVYRFLIGLSGSMVFISIIRSIMENKEWGRSIIEKLGSHSMHIYILQGFIIWVVCKEHIEVLLRFVPPIVITNQFFYEYVYCLLLAILFFVCSYYISKLLEKSKYINRFVFGKID